MCLFPGKSPPSLDFRLLTDHLNPYLVHFCLIEPGGTRTNFAGDSMAWLANHPAYAAPDTPTRVLEGYVKSPDMQATWVPSSFVADAMYEIAARKQPIPMRFPTGAPSWTVIKGETVAVAEALDEIKELSFAVDDGSVNKSGEFLTKKF